MRLDNRYLTSKHVEHHPFGTKANKNHSNKGERKVLYTCDMNYRFHVAPSSIRLEDGSTICTWKYESDQSNYNFEIQFPLETVKEEFYWEAGHFFRNDFRDQIKDISDVVVRDGLLIIGGLKQKGNEDLTNGSTKE